MAQPRESRASEKCGKEQWASRVPVRQPLLQHQNGDGRPTGMDVGGKTESQVAMALSAMVRAASRAATPWSISASEIMSGGAMTKWEIHAWSATPCFIISAAT